MPLPDIAIEPVRDARALRAFIRFAWRVYRGDPHWVPPLIADQEKMLDRTKHPFHRHAEVEYFVARQGANARTTRAGEVVGRIAAIVNHTHNEVHGEKTGFFGFFECLPDGAAAPGLFGAAADWLRSRGMERMRGPANFSANEEWGCLVDGFDSSPMVMMTYNPRHYPEILERSGFTKVKDLVAYYMEEGNLPERLVRGAERIQAQGKITVRSLDMKRFDAEVARVRDVYNAAWEKNWGFVPMSEAEIEHMARELKPVVDPKLVLFAEMGGKTIGFALALPDAYQALKKANGRLFPFGLIRLLLEARRIHRIRVLTLGVIRECRGNGADALLYLQLYKNGVARGYRAGEFSWILEDNVAMRRPLEHLGAKVYKTYRLYDRPL